MFLCEREREGERQRGQGLLWSKGYREGVQLSQREKKHSQMMRITQPEASETDTETERESGESFCI